MRVRRFLGVVRGRMNRGCTVPLPSMLSVRLRLPVAVRSIAVAVLDMAAWLEVNE